MINPITKAPTVGIRKNGQYFLTDFSICSSYNVLQNVFYTFLYPVKNVFDAVVCGAYLHGYIGEELSKEMYTVNATNIINNIQRTMKKLKTEINL